jgi:uncharacterized protein YxjI
MMRQRTFAFGDDYTMRDESGQPAYIIDGKALRVFNPRNVLELVNDGFDNRTLQQLSLSTSR